MQLKGLQANISGKSKVSMVQLLNRSVDVINLVSKHSSYPIKADLSPDERKQESLLMTEQLQLIQSGVNHKLIKLGKQSLYVAFKLAI